MQASKYATALFALFVLAAAPPAAGESCTVLLVNGSELESRYAPKVSATNPEKLELLTDLGNPISLDRRYVREIRCAPTGSGFDRTLDTRPRYVGRAPNDRPTAEAEATASGDGNLTAAVLDHLVQRRLDALEGNLRRAQANTVRQFADPTVAGTPGGTGLPLWPGPVTTPSDELLAIQGLVGPPVDPTRGWQLGQPTSVPLTGLAAAPPSAFVDGGDN